MSYKVIPRLKLTHPLDPTMPYMSTDGKIDECIIVTNDDTMVLQNKYHIMSCQIARQEDYGLSGHVFKKTIVAYRGVENNGKKSIEKEIFHVLDFLKKIGSHEVEGKASDADYGETKEEDLHIDTPSEEKLKEQAPAPKKAEPTDAKKEIQELAKKAVAAVSPKVIVQGVKAVTKVQPVAMPKLKLKGAVTNA